MKTARQSLVLLSFLFATSVALGQGNCPDDLDPAIHLPEVREAAQRAIAASCNGSSEAEMAAAYMTFLDDIAGWFDDFGGFQGDKYPVNNIKSIISQGIADSVAVGLSANDTLLVGEEEYVPAAKNTCDQKAGADCAVVTDEFISYYTSAQRAYSSIAVGAVIQNIAALRKRWDPFLETMRGQTTLELAINGWWFKRDETTTFSAPPSKQWIVLHPVLLVENVSAAVDGEKTKEALGVELFGVNWWEQDKWYIPSGASVIAMYSDRQDVDDWGYGAALHFKSVYTLGYTYRDGDSGIFVSLDLLKLFQDKNAAFRSYIDR